MPSVVDAMILAIVLLAMACSVLGGSIGATVNQELALQAAPTFGNASTRTSSSILVKFPVMTTLGGGNVAAYEISKRSIQNSHWETVSDSIGTAGYNISEVQIINIRVDVSSAITGGTFQLGITRAGLTPDDFQHQARTSPIPYNANAGQMKAALEHLTNVKVREVKRCDEFGDGGGVSAVGLGGFEQWVFGCPQGARGAFRWLVVFDLPVGANPAALSVFNMYSYRNDLVGAWTGSGPQVTVARIVRGMINPSLCLYGTCSYNVTGLQEGTPYAFRTRALTFAAGWTEYSKQSDFESTLEPRPPSRMRPPIITATTLNSALLTIKLPPDAQGVHTLKTEYRAKNANHWKAGPGMDLVAYAESHGYRIGKQVIIKLEGLFPSTQYESRCAGVNDIGTSIFSSSSDVFETAADLEKAYTPVAPLIEGDVGSSHVEVMLQSLPAELQLSTKPITYRLQYRSELESTWHNHQDQVVFQTNREGVEIQKILSRSTGTRSTYNQSSGALLSVIDTRCVGYFYLRIGAVSSDAVTNTVSSPITFDASTDELVSALYSIGQVKAANPRITAHRNVNEFKGYTWTVEIQGMGDIPRLQLQKHTLYAEDLSTGQRVGECYEEAPADPVLSSTLQDGENVASAASKVLRVGGLSPQRGYYFRVQVLDTENHNAPGQTSKVTFVRTTPDFASDAKSSVVGLDGILPEDRATESTVSRKIVGKKMGPAVAYGGVGAIPAKSTDMSYSAGASIGGVSGQPGGNGYCNAISYNARLSQPTSTFQFYYTGTEQTFVIPPATPSSGTVMTMTFRCWGGGGGGGKPADLNSEIHTAAAMLALSAGGGGAYAQMSVAVNPGDVFTILIGGGGRPNTGGVGGKGGYGFGGKGGNALHGGGGGGGGLSVVRRGGEILLVAAGGGGGGSSDYCCGSGGAGGGVGTAENGKSPAFNTPWPLKDLSTDRPTSVRRRYEYTSHVCPDDLTGDFCISEWDILPGSLPVLHTNLQWGEALNANYTLWAMPGKGASWESGGMPGQASSFQVRTTGPGLTMVFDGRAAVYSQGEGIEQRGEAGGYMYGGKGAGGKEGGGGGGGGFFGGGGGGSGIDAGGGGGGSSYYNSTAAHNGLDLELIDAHASTPRTAFVNESAVTLEWTLNWDRALWGVARSYDVEMSLGPDSEDFFRIAQIEVNEAFARNQREATSSYTATDLSPKTTYSFRVVPVFPQGRGTPSQKKVITTLALAINYWEPLTARRLSLGGTARGFSNPALQRPHLTPGVEHFGSQASVNAQRYSDPTTSEAQAFPSPRRGSTISLVDDFVYMFGGRSNGYSCASTFKDTLNMGTPESGREVYPCTTQTAETNEMWSFDIHNFRWIFINTTAMAASTPPPPRESHTSTVINGFIYVFGGKTRTFPSDPTTKLPIFTDHSDVVHGDFWKFKVPQVAIETMVWPQPSELAKAPMAIPENRRLFVTLDGGVVLGASAANGDGENARSGKCIQSIIVRVKVNHPCINQLRISITGPSPDSGSPNFHAHSTSHEVLLYNQRKTNGTGCAGGSHQFNFDETSERFTDACCTQTFEGTYRPEGRLSEFVGASAIVEWNLVLQDMKVDGIVGTLQSWEIEFELEECFKVYTWTKIPPQASSPAERYGAKAIAYQGSLFVFGGRDISDNVLTDLYRFNTGSLIWTKLTPVNFNVVLETASSVGSNFALTSWGLLRYGGYYRQPTFAQEYDNYVTDNFLMDPVTLRWRKVEVEPWPQADGTGMTTPRPRYLSAIAFIPSSVLHFKKSYSYRNLYDTYPRSTHANYANALADSVLVYGGHDGATGGIYDGSTGGLLGDMWMLRLSNFSTDGQRYAQAKYMKSNCEWRGGAAAVSLGLTSCMSNTANSNCDFRDMMMLAWCSNTNQTVS